MFDESVANAKNAVNNIEHIYSIIEKLFNSKQNITNSVPDKTFSGGITDIATCKDGLSAETLKGLQKTNPELYESTVKVLENAEKKGLVSIDFDSGKINLTEKGKEFTAKPEFQKQLGIDKSNTIQNGTVKEFGTPLKCDKTDLRMFKNTDTIDLEKLKFTGNSVQQKQAAKKFAENIKSFEKNGLVKLQGNKIKLTEKGLKMANNPAFKKAFANGAEMALGAVPGGQAVLITKSVLAAKQVASAAKTATNIVGGAL